MRQACAQHCLETLTEADRPPEFGKKCTLVPSTSDFHFIGRFSAEAGTCACQLASSQLDIRIAASLLDTIWR